MYRRLFSPFIFCFFLLFLIEDAKAQHYFFIEADNQQPFYARWNGKLLSSSTSGFLLVPKVGEEKILLTVGFPQNQFPEQNFELLEMDRDRGFQLKNFGEKGWGLFDRTSLVVIMSVSANSEKAIALSKPTDNGFSAVLAEVTGDSTLREHKKEQNLPVPAKKQVLSVSTPLRDSLVKDDRIKNFDISNVLLLENDSVKVMGYMIKNDQGGMDTVRAEITKPFKIKEVAVEPVGPAPVIDKVLEKSPSPPPAVKVVVCNRPIAEIKDVKSLQRKILGSSDPSEQVSMAVKEYKVKCFSSRQTMDLGWMIADESLRLQFFKALKDFVSDPDQFVQLESVFMKDENIREFRKVLGKN